MEPYEVLAASAEFKRWIKVRSPNFVIYTDARRKHAMKLLEQMEIFHIAFQHIIGRNAQVRAPTIVVLPTAGSDWRKMQSKGNVDWKVAMSAANGSVADASICQYNWQKTGLYVVWSSLTSSRLNAVNIDGTFWFRRGMNRFFETVNFSGRKITIGYTNSRTTTLVHDGWLPWERFFEITGSSPEFTKDGSALHKFNGQSAAFTQYMLAHKDPIWQGRLSVWNAFLATGRPPSEEDFETVFGQNWEEWSETMKEYLERGKYRVVTFDFPDEILVFRREQLPLPTEEMRELFIITKILNQSIPESDHALDALLARGLKTEALRELLVEACLERGNAEGAREQLQALIDNDSQNPAVYSQAAWLVFSSHVSEFSLDSRLPADSAVQIRKLCNAAISIEPLNLLASETLAWTEAFSPTIRRSNLNTLEELCRRMDGNGQTGELIAALAIARWRSGQDESAIAACNPLLASAYASESMRNLAEELMARVDASSDNP